MLRYSNDPIKILLPALYDCAQRSLGLKRGKVTVTGGERRHDIQGDYVRGDGMRREEKSGEEGKEVGRLCKRRRNFRK